MSWANKKQLKSFSCINLNMGCAVYKFKSIVCLFICRWFLLFIQCCLYLQFGDRIKFEHSKIWLVFELYFSILSPFPALFTVKICSYWAEPFIYPWFLVLWLLWPFCFCSYLLSLCVLKEKNSYIKSNHIAVELNTMSLTQGRGRLWKDLWK